MTLRAKLWGIFVTPDKQSILYAWEKNRDYGERLVADLTEQQLVRQPGPGMNHPAWVFSHLNIYLPVIRDSPRVR